MKRETRRYAAAGAAAGVSVALAVVARVLAGSDGLACQVEIKTDLPIDAWPKHTDATACDPTEKPGPVAFREMVLAGLGGTDVGIKRTDCEQGVTVQSLHHEGRAWDWGPPSSWRADDFVWCMTAGDAELARRAGICEVIWNGEIWTSGHREWRPYGGADPHTSHVHFGFSKEGAAGLTSLYSVLESGQLMSDASVRSARRVAPRVAAAGSAAAALASSILLEKL